RGPLGASVTYEPPHACKSARLLEDENGAPDRRTEHFDGVQLGRRGQSRHGESFAATELARVRVAYSTQLPGARSADRWLTTTRRTGLGAGSWAPSSASVRSPCSMSHRAHPSRGRIRVGVRPTPVPPRQTGSLRRYRARPRPRCAPGSSG